MSKLLEIKYQLENINTVAKQVLEHVNSKTLLFYGDMGVGKTTLIKSIAKEIGSLDQVSSPTFSIVNEYEAKNILIYHFDLYRIEDEDEALNFGFDDYLNSQNWVFVEWPQNAENLMPDDANIIEISYNDLNSRSLKLNQKQN
ncbi:tRNA (adenosine(37)-N6)-threonylcarbamoyltransferase complex ATPase subunit type 1 TsaE [Psychroserpens sp. Hel_I_66]|uniref:tRNA (adenosine(37)-N6)-threonylcarbamoyltransferase complex ATPase subunit type 1 TsaE n=1 Tax=Psychroserpens sp. Hel_I_66 TaxID=1250004 RepID=UPI000646AD3F|nr:tRNA (adenosine(37)-N6)-threonylcarbamoyltransferase complex ATPase subunit type 1 TsaE [Psychroserpens sp. Hel_I_66]